MSPCGIAVWVCVLFDLAPGVMGSIEFRLVFWMRGECVFFFSVDPCPVSLAFCFGALRVLG